jgi:hypothetical protein
LPPVRVGADRRGRSSAGSVTLRGPPCGSGAEPVNGDIEPEDRRASIDSAAINVKRPMSRLSIDCEWGHLSLQPISSLLGRTNPMGRPAHCVELNQRGRRRTGMIASSTSPGPMSVSSELLESDPKLGRVTAVHGSVVDIAFRYRPPLPWVSVDAVCHWS